MDDIVHVDCGSCRACCKNQLILLDLQVDDPKAYDCDVMEGPGGKLYSVKHRANGDCIYLGPAGCNIHGYQPAVCRMFDCVAFAEAWPRERRRREKIATHQDPVFKAGQRRLRTRRTAERADAI